MRKRNQTLLRILSVLGIIFMSYAVYAHYFGSAVCNISETFSCDAVNQSEYSTVFGIPVAVFGVFYFTLIFLASLFSKNKKNIVYLFYFSLVSIFFGLYLTIVELTVLRAVCIICESAKLLIIGIIVILFIELKREELL